jgi:hypothetical protein
LGRQQPQLHAGHGDAQRVVAGVTVVGDDPGYLNMTDVDEATLDSLDAAPSAANFPTPAASVRTNTLIRPSASGTRSAAGT